MSDLEEKLKHTVNGIKTLNNALSYNIIDNNKVHEDMQKAFERYIVIRDILLENEDQGLLKELDKLIGSAQRYMELVVNQENNYRRWRERCETFEYQELVKNYDMQRRIVHNSIISSIWILNRNLFKNYPQMGIQIPEGGIYSSNSETIVPEKDNKGNYNFNAESMLSNKREKIANWAALLVYGIIKNENV